MRKPINQEKLNASLRMLDKMGEQNLELMKVTDPQQAHRLEQLGTLFGNEDFCQQFVSCPDAQTAVTLFADHGFLLSEEEAAALMVYIKDIAARLIENDGELSEEELELISGGAAMGGIMGTICGGLLGFALGFLFGCPGIGAVIGASIGASIGGFSTDF